MLAMGTPVSPNAAEMVFPDLMPVDPPHCMAPETMACTSVHSTPASFTASSATSAPISTQLL